MADKKRMTLSSFFSKVGTTCMILLVATPTLIFLLDYPRSYYYACWGFVIGAICSYTISMILRVWEDE